MMRKAQCASAIVFKGMSCMKARQLSAVTVLALAWFATAATPAQAQATLRYKFVKGQVNNYETFQEIRFSQNVGGANVEMEIKHLVETSQTVNDVLEDGSAKVTD